MAEKNIKISGPIHNEGLEEVIGLLKQGSTPEKQARLGEELKKAKLLSPCTFEETKDAQGRIHVRPDQMKFFLLNTQDGKTFFPVFTDFEKTKLIHFAKDEPKHIVSTIPALARMLSAKDQKAQGLIVNPGADNIVIPKNMVLMLAGVQTKVAPAPSRPAVKAQYSEPRIYPTRMVTAVYDYCTGKKEISRVWLKQKIAGGTVSFVFVIEADKQDQSIADGILSAATPLRKDVPLETVWYSEAAEKEIVKGGVALYDRNLEL